MVFSHGSFNRWGITRKSRIKKELYLRLLERANVEGALFVAFNAQEELQLSLFSDKGVVVPSGIDPSEYGFMPERGSWRRQRGLDDKTIFLYFNFLSRTS